jgi:hypothetical protein
VDSLPSRGPIVAAVAGLGAAIAVILRGVLPDVAAFNALADTTPPAILEITTTLGALALGAAIGAFAATRSRVLAVVFSVGLAIPAWLAIAVASVLATAKSVTSGDAVIAAMMLSPIWLIVAVMCLVVLLFLCAASGLLLSFVAPALAKAPRRARLGALAFWPLALGAAGVSIAAVPPDVESTPPPAPVAAPPPRPLPCDETPFAGVVRGAGLRGPSRVLPDEIVEYRVITPIGGTLPELEQTVAGINRQTAPCTKGHSMLHLRVVTASTVGLKLHLQGKPRPGEDATAFQPMLESHLRSAFDGALHVTADGNFATSVHAAWRMIGAGAVKNAFTCEALDPAVEVRCDGDEIEVRTYGVAPVFSGVVLEKPPKGH